MLARHSKEMLRRSMVMLPPMADYMSQQTRSIQLFEIFSKEKRKERRKQLMEETNRGYFDDFRDFRDSKGKVFYSPERLLPFVDSKQFPVLEDTILPDGQPYPIPPPLEQAPDASLVCAAFRAGAEPMLKAWATPFSEKYKDTSNVALYELSLVEGSVMKLWPFKQLILRTGIQNKDKYPKETRYLFRFGETDEIRSALYMTNRLTGYVYLLDKEGKVRWRGSGNPDGKELTSLMSCAEQLLSSSSRTTSVDLSSTTSD